MEKINIHYVHRLYCKVLEGDLDTMIEFIKYYQKHFPGKKINPINLTRDELHTMYVKLYEPH